MKMGGKAYPQLGKAYGVCLNANLFFYARLHTIQENPREPFQHQSTI
jgi:hypothetical protein